jgi:hypothetical protein
MICTRCGGKGIVDRFPVPTNDYTVCHDCDGYGFLPRNDDARTDNVCEEEVPWWLEWQESGGEA